jgi:hypothetical protein
VESIISFANFAFQCGRIEKSTHDKVVSGLVVTKILRHMH